MSKDVSLMGVEIPNNQALTGEIDLGGFSLMAIELPATFNATSITFQAKSERGNDESDNLETWKNVYDDAGTEVTVTVAGNRIVGLDAVAMELAALRFIRIRAGTSAAPANQSPKKQINLILKG